MLLPLLAPQVAPIVALAPSPYETATAHRRAGRHGEAVKLYRTSLDLEPDNVDALVGLGLSLAALGRNAEAETALARAVVLAPAYADAQIGLARLSAARGDKVGAQALLTTVLGADPQNADALRLARQLATPDGARVARRLDFSAGSSELSDGLPAWSEATVVITLPVGPGWTASAAVEASRRFDRNDLFIQGGVSRAHASGGSWRLVLGGAPEADFRPELSVTAGGSFPLGGGSPVTAVLDAGWARYRTVEVVSFSPGLRIHLGERLSLQGRWVAADPSDGDLLSGFAIRADVAAGPETRLALTYADAPESSEGAPVTVETFSVAASRDISDQITLSLTASHETRDSFTRDEIVLGSALRF